MNTPRFHIYPRGDGRFNISMHNPKGDSWRSNYRTSRFALYINPMPGATGGFNSIRDALLAIRCIEHVERRTGVLLGHGFDSDRWWHLYWRVSGVTQRSRKQRHRLAQRLGYRNRNHSVLEPISLLP